MTQTRPKPLPNLPVYAVNWGSDAPVNSVCIRYIDPTLFDHGTYHVSYDYALQVLELLGLPSAPMVRMPAPSRLTSRWTSDSANDVDEIIARAGQLRLAASPSGYQKCLDLCYRLLERPQTAGSDRNLWDFHKCMNACLARGF